MHTLLLRRIVRILVLTVCVQAAAQTSNKPTQESVTQQPVKLAEGSYGGTDSWTLWATPKGMTSEIQIHWAPDVAKGGQQRETLDLLPDFTWRRIRYEALKLPGLPDGALQCDREEETLECISTFKGESGRGSLPFAGAYALQFGVHIAFFDNPWFYTTLVAESDRDPKQPRTMGLVTLAFDGSTPETLVTGNGAEIIAGDRYRITRSATRRCDADNGVLRNNRCNFINASTAQKKQDEKKE